MAASICCWPISQGSNKDTAQLFCWCTDLCTEPSKIKPTRGPDGSVPGNVWSRDCWEGWNIGRTSAWCSIHLFNNHEEHPIYNPIESRDPGCCWEQAAKLCLTNYALSLAGWTGGFFQQKISFKLNLHLCNQDLLLCSGVSALFSLKTLEQKQF